MASKKYIERVWIDDNSVNAITTDGLKAAYCLNEWPRLFNATKEQLNNFYLSYGGIHWPDLDEDLSFEGMFSSTKLCDVTITEDSVCYDPDSIEESNSDCVADDAIDLIKTY